MAQKQIYETDEVKAFAAGMSSVSRRKYAFAKQVLADMGYLRAPIAEKVEGQENLFAIRILSDGNERFFYCYDDGTLIVILHGYAKTTNKIPPRELATAIRVKNELFGGAS